MAPSNFNERRDALARAWLARIASSSSPGVARMLVFGADTFRNPVGHAYEQALPELIDEAFGTAALDEARVRAALEPIVRIRAVQEDDGEDPAAFVLVLADLARDSGFGAAADLQARIEKLAALTRELHAECRRRIEEIRAREARLRRLAQ